MLDVDISSRLILDDILGIKDLRSDKRIDFVGGLRGQRVAWILIFVLQYGHSFSVAGAGAAGFSNIFFAR